MNISTEEENIGAQFMLRIPGYDISQKVKEANEALKKDDSPSRETKQFRVKFGPIVVHYEPETANSSDTAWEESTDSTGREQNGSMIESSSNSLPSEMQFLQKKQVDFGGYCSMNTFLLNTHTDTQNHCFMGNSTGKNAEYTVADFENKFFGKNCNSPRQIEMKESNQKNGEISLSNFSEILNGMEFNEECERGDKNEELPVSDGTSIQVADEKMSFTTVTLLKKGEDEVLFDKEGNTEDDNINSKQQEASDEPFSFSSEEFIGFIKKNEPHFEDQPFGYIDELQKEVHLSHQNQADTSSKRGNNVSVLQKSQQKYLMHHKWSSARLPTYNGLNSEYGLTAEMLEERKRKAEIIRQKFWERKKQEEEMKEQKKKENDESFREWLRKKEAERRKSAEKNNTYEFVYDQQEAENAFQAWLRRKAKELRQQKKQNEAQKEYEKKIAQRQTYEECQREFKRWLREKVKKSSQPGKHKNSNTFSSRRKSFKRYVAQKNMHMKSTCRIYLGH